MKVARIILLILSILCLLGQALGYVGNLLSGGPDFAQKNIYYFIGFNLLAIAGIIFFFISIWLKNKIKSKESRVQVDNLFTDDINPGSKTKYASGRIGEKSE